jgi:hypothetical protein
MKTKRFSLIDIAIGVAWTVALWGVARLLDVDLSTILLVLLLVLSTVAVVRGKPEGVRRLAAISAAAFALTVVGAIGIVALGAL